MTLMEDLRTAVFSRDDWTCQAARLDSGHRCRNRWGFTVPPHDPTALTLEHVRLDPGGARRDDERFCVTLCYGANVIEHWGSAWENRSRLNDLLDRRYPERRVGL